MNENILKNFENLNCFKAINLLDNNDILYDSSTLLFAEIFLCELNILLTFHYMVFMSELELYIK